MSKQAGWDEIVQLWANGRPPDTLEIYIPVINSLRNHVQQTPPGEITLQQLQSWAGTFKSQRPATRTRKIATVRSLLGFAKRIGAIERDQSPALRAPANPDGLANRILNEKEVQLLVQSGANHRENVLLSLLYVAGLRATEAGRLQWKDCLERSNGLGQISVLGKRQKRRSIVISPEVWEKLMSLRTETSAGEDYVFQSRNGWRQPLSRTRIADIVRFAAQRAKLEAKVSPHWIRHCHASHAIDHGAPLSLVSQTLGHASIAATARYIHASPDQSSSAYIRL